MHQSASKIILVFPSIHHVLRAEKALNKRDLPFDLIPVPKEVNPDCGMAVEIESSDQAMVGRVLDEAGLKVEERYRRVGNKFEKQI